MFKTSKIRHVPATMPFSPLFPSPPAAAAPRLIIHGLLGKTDDLLMVASVLRRSIYNERNGFKKLFDYAILFLNDDTNNTQPCNEVY